MSNLAVSPVAPPQGDPSQQVQNQAAGIPFGRLLGRIAMIPLRRWPLSLVLLVLGGAVAFFAGQSLRESTYRVEGQLLYTPMAEVPETLRAIYTPLSPSTVRGLIRAPAHAETICTEFELAVPPQTFARLPGFDDRYPEDGQITGITLDWGDGNQGAQILNRLMTLVRDQVIERRREAIGKAITATKASLTEATAKLQAARNEHVAFLEQKKVSDPTTELLALRTEYQTLAKEEDTLRTRQKTGEEQIRRLREEILALQAGQEDSPKPALGDEDFRKNKRELELQLGEADSRVAEDQRRLKQVENELATKAGLNKAIPGSVLKSELERLRGEVKGQKDKIKNGESRVAALKAALKEIRPNTVAIQRAQGKIRTLQDERIDLDAQAKQLTAKMRATDDAAGKMRAIKEEEAPLLQRRALAEKKQAELDARLQKLEALFDESGSEVTILTEAAPSPFPGSTRKKMTFLALAASILCLFGIMIAYDMTTPSWRAESLADRVGLPVLARMPLRASGRPDDGEVRALSLRLRQYVPAEGAVLLLSSLNESHGIADLIADLGGFLAIRDERILVLDARIANADAEDLRRSLARRPVAQPIEVSPADTHSPPRGSSRGLVQFLVFEGINLQNLVVPTRATGVDFVPAGGPYPITDALASGAMSELIEGYRKLYTLILLVGPAASRATDTEILAAYAAGVVFVINEPLSTSASASQALFRSLKEANVPLLGTVLCY